MQKISKNRSLLILPGMALLAAALVLLLTHWGPGLFDWDSFNYIASARNLATGNGLRIPLNPDSLRPMSHYPPLYPLVLAGFEFLGLDAIVAARWLNALLMGANLLLFSSIAKSLLKSTWLALVASGLFLLSPRLLEAHAWALREPLLIFFFLFASFSFVQWRRRPEPLWLLALYVAVALATMTKFIGITLAPALAIALIMEQPRQAGNRLRGLGAMLAGLLPFLLWSLRNYLVGAAFNSRVFIFNPITRGNLETAFRSFASWFMPMAWVQGREGLVLAAALGLLIAFGLFLYWKRMHAEAKFPALIQLGCYLFLFYIPTVLFAKMFFDPGIGFQSRMFIPVFPMLLLVVFWGIDLLVNDRLPINRVLAFVALALLLFGTLMAARLRLPNIYANGLGWSRRAIVQSTALADLRSRSTDLEGEFFSNDAFGLYLLTGEVGRNFANFPPPDPHADVYVVIFTHFLEDDHALPSRYSQQLDLVARDEILSLYTYSP